MEYTEIDDFREDDFYTDKNRTAGDRRKKDYQKAVSRRNKDISRKISYEYGTAIVHPWYKYLHQYSKNKIHCSCPLCAFNAKRHGRVIFGKKLPIGDKKREEACRQQLVDYRYGCL